MTPKVDAEAMGKLASTTGVINWQIEHWLSRISMQNDGKVGVN
jgi:hypothetical protein